MGNSPWGGRVVLSCVLYVRCINRFRFHFLLPTVYEVILVYEKKKNEQKMSAVRPTIMGKKRFWAPGSDFWAQNARFARLDSKTPI